MGKGSSSVLAAGVAVACLFAGCTSDADSPPLPDPATVEDVSGRDEKRVTFTTDAATRADLQTGVIGAGPGGSRTVVPYSAVLYDTSGSTWTYVTVGGLSFIREPITVDQINGDIAYLTEGPPAGTRIAVSGVALLYGAESGVGK